MTVRSAGLWAFAAFSSIALGALVDHSTKLAVSAVAVFAIMTLAAQVARFPATQAYAASLVLSSAVIDLPSRVHFGRFTANAALTIVYSITGVLLVLFPHRSRIRAATGPLRALSALFLFAALSLAWGAPSIAGLQNLLVLLVFLVGVVCGIQTAGRHPEPGRFAARIFGVGSGVALLLYAAGLSTGKLGSGTVVGNRSFALFALLSIAWGVSGWRYQAPLGRTLTILSGLFILLSLSRTAFAVALVIGCLAWMNPRSVTAWTRLLFSAGVVIGVGYEAVEHIRPLHDRIFKGDVHSYGGLSINVEGRSQLWATTWHSYLKSPFFGHGAGTADRLISSLYPGVGHPHNDYLRLLHDYGLLGLCLWVLGYGWLVVRTWRSWQAHGPESEKAGGAEKRIHCAAFLALVALALSMVTDNVLDYLFVMGPAGVLVGLSLGLAARRPRATDHPILSSMRDPSPRLARPTRRLIGRSAIEEVPRAEQRVSLTPVAVPRSALVPERSQLGTDAGRRLNALGRRLGFAFLGGVLDALFTFGLTLTVTHVLAAAGAGAFFQVLALFAILLTVLQLGAGTSAVKVVAEYRATGRASDTSRVLGVALVPAASVSLLAAGALFVFAPQFAAELVRHGNPHDTEVYLRVLAPSVPVAVIAAILMAATRGLGSMVPTILTDRVFEPTFRLLAIALALGVFGAVSPEVLGTLWVFPVGVGLLVAVAAVSWTTRRAKGVAFNPRAPWSVLARRFWTFAFPQWLAEVFQVAVLWLDVILVGALASSREAGIYGAVSRLVTVGTLGLAALVLVLAPEMSSAFATGELQRVKRLYSSATTLLMAGSAPVLLVMATFAPLLARVFGGGFRSGATPLAILAIAMLVDVVAGPALLTLLMGGRSQLVLMDSGVAFAANISLNVLLIPRFGMTGAALAWAASIVAINLLAVVQIRQLWGVRPFDGNFLRLAASAGTCFGAGAWLSGRIGGQTPGAMVVAFAVLFAVYGVLLWKCRTGLGLTSIAWVIAGRG